MLNLPTIRQLQYLIALHRTNNFGRAAVACNVTQPTLSQAIVEMETILGAKVLDRSKRKTVTFTPFGQQVVETSKHIMPYFESLLENARQLQEPLSGIIRLGIIPTIAPYLLPKFLPPLQNQFKKMSFQIVEAMSHILIEKLENGEVDIVLMALPFETKEFKNIKLYEEIFYLASPKGTFKKEQKVTIDDLDNKNLLLLQDGNCLRDHILSACKKVNITLEQPLSASSLYTIIQMVGQGYGVTLLPEMVVKQDNLPKTIELHSFKNPVPTRQIGLVWRNKTYKQVNIQAVVKAFKTILKA